MQKDQRNIPSKVISTIVHKIKSARRQCKFIDEVHPLPLVTDEWTWPRISPRDVETFYYTKQQIRQFRKDVKIKAVDAAIAA